jgi:ferrous iron transport protein B
MCLSDLKVNKSGRVLYIEPCGNRLRFLEMGLVPNTEVTVVFKTAFSGPIEIEVRGYRLTLRASDAEKIIISPL